MTGLIQFMNDSKVIYESLSSEWVLIANFDTVKLLINTRQKKFLLKVYWMLRFVLDYGAFLCKWMKMYLNFLEKESIYSTVDIYMYRLIKSKIH